MRGGGLTEFSTLSFVDMEDLLGGDGLLIAG